MKEVHRELKQQWRLRQIKRHLKENICAMETFAIIAFCTDSILFTNYAIGGPTGSP